MAGAGIGRTFYLGGGAGLALHLGHRRSADLDFFTRQGFSARDLQRELGTLTGFQPVEQSEDTLHATVDGVPVSFLAYPYPLVEPPTPLQPGVPVASIRDIGAMKVSAIVRRGRRRDFIDLYMICRRLRIEDVLESLQQKAGPNASNPYILAKALVYFVDAEQDPPPRMLVPCEWNDVRRFFEGEVKRMFA